MKTTKSTSAFILWLCISLVRIYGQTYCVPIPTNGTQYDTYIDGVQLEDIENVGTGSPTDTCYHEYLGYKTMLSLGNSYTLTLTGSPYYSNMHYVAWIDYNIDGDFSDSGEKLGEFVTTSANQVFDINFTVPNTALVAETRLRVRTVYNVTNPDPCTDYDYGETEDYTVLITDFDKIDLGIPGGYGDINFFNYNTDNDYDIFVFDYIQDSVFFYVDLGSYYTPYDNISGDFPDMWNISFAPADLNHDNVLDAVFTGRLQPSQDPKTIYYLASGSNLVQQPSQMINLKWGSSACADLNNDGRRDIIITGRDIDDVPRTLIYQNNIDSLIFVKELFGVCYGKVSCADYDNDMDIDIFIGGTDNFGGPNSIIYRNDGNWNFTDINARLPKLDNGSVVWGDYNSDGRLDITMLTNDLRVYRNDGNDEFSLVFKSTNDIYDKYCDLKWNDYNNDGDLDIFTAIGGAYNQINILEHVEKDSFALAKQFYIDALTDYDIADYDDDQDIDILANTTSIHNIFMLENRETVVNKNPDPPTDLQAVINAPEIYAVSLSWSPATDDATPQQSLTYNIKVGTVSGGNNIVSSQTNTVGNLLVPGIGNVYTNTSWVIKDLAPGIYYWSIQTIDNTYNSSAFSVQDTFEILAPLTLSSYDFRGRIIQDCPAVDLDADNNMDIILAHFDSIKIYRQINTGSYTMVNLTTGATILGTGDVNNDNLPDMIFGKNDSLGLYINMGSGNFNILMIDSLSPSEVSLADYDNDGDIDILLIDENIFILECTDSLVYNTIQIDIGYPFYQNSVLSIADIDNDNDMDFIISGDVDESYFSNEFKTLILRNTGDLNFEISQELYPGLGPVSFYPGGMFSYYASPSVMWNDYNFDGNIDFLIVGKDIYASTKTYLYINNGSGLFIYKESGLRPTDSYIPSCFDYNSDGYTDAVFDLMGKKESVIYLNDQNNTYYPFHTVLDSIDKGWSVDHLDIDNDNDQDIIVSVATPIMPENFKFNTKVYINNGTYFNDPPEPPSETSHSFDSSFNIHLYWNKGIDDLTGENGITYNIWVGTKKDKPDIISPLSDLTTGKRYYNAMGNVGTNRSWTLKDLPVKTYYWSVQAIDNSLQAGPWAPVDSFRVSEISPDFLYEPVLCLGKETQFIDFSVTTDSIIAWKWFFGDNTTDSLQDPVHVYQTADTFEVTLWTYISTGDSTSKKHSLIVKPAPVASFSVDPVCLGETSDLIDKSKVDGITIDMWRWYYGNGNISPFQGSTTQSYTKTDTAWLYIRATNGCQDADTQVVIVGEYPDATIFLEEGYGSQFCEGDSSVLKVNEYDSKNRYIWQHDRVPIVINRPALGVKQTGNYSLLVIDPIAGCKDSSDNYYLKKLPAPPKPEMIISKGSDSLCPNENVTLSVTNVIDEYEYDWWRNGYFYSDENEEYLSGHIPEGDYQARAHIFGACGIKSDIVTITHKTAPEKPSIFSNDGPELFIMSCDITNAKTYQWYKNGDKISGANREYYIVGSEEARYSVEITQEGLDCPVRSGELLIPYLILPVENIQQSVTFNLYPNPAEDHITLSLNSPYHGDIFIEVTDLAGRKISVEKYIKNEIDFEINMDTHTFGKGIYYINVGYENQKIVKTLYIK